jgi:flagellar biogenesis protein FliO
MKFAPNQTQRFICHCTGLAFALAVAATSMASSTHAQTLRTSTQPATAVDRILSSQPATPRYDNNVVRMNFDQAPLRAEAPRDGWTTGDVRAIASYNDEATSDMAKKPNFIQREKQGQADTSPSTKAVPKKQSFGKLIANMGMNLAFVLLVGIGFIVISKQWLKPQASLKKESSDHTSSLRVTEELVLEGKTSIRVIQWKDSEILVASDATGVRSMVALTPNFSDTLDQVETEFEERESEPEKVPSPSRSRPTAKKTPPQDSSYGVVDDRLIKMLLDSANRSAAASKLSSKKGNA